jgi:transcriptional regulator with PAS, ATPase and Fis domain
MTHAMPETAESRCSACAEDRPCLLGTSAAARALAVAIRHAARSDAKVLITGESGAGKEVAARSIHAHSVRREAPFVAVNCAGLSETLLESELFGHVKGSFTGAHRDRAGLIETAAGGTVLLDETSEMSPRLQGMLLRFLDAGEIQRIGSDRVHRRADVRVIAATNKDLRGEVAAGRFRADLYYRLNVIHLQVPPLRERREDIPALLAQLLAEHAGRYDATVPELAPDALACLTAYAWPGNVRELRNVAEQLVIGHRRSVIEAADLPDEVRAPQPAVAAAPARTLPVGLSDPDAIYERMVDGRESFWAAVYDPFMSHDLTRAQVAFIVRKGLERTRGDFRLLVQLFNMDDADDKPFRSFLRRHQCHMQL